MRFIRYAAVGIVAIILILTASAYLALRASLPQLDGTVHAARLTAPAAIARDSLGVPEIRARSREDLAFATGFAHAQDRFFQMDLTRRAAAGELAELLGEGLIATDKRLRTHGFSQVARQVLDGASARDRGILGAYAAGVNFALARSQARPWEYLLLGAQPREWRLEDSILVAFSMYLDLNDSTGDADLARARLRGSLPGEMFAFLEPLGTEWDAPMTGGVLRPPPIPGPQVMDLRQGEAREAALLAPPGNHDESAVPAAVGSNGWVVAGTHTAEGDALLANDMHLSLRLPHVWYRARLVVDAEDERARDLVGVTLPGLPMLVAGSNGEVAWGFTNSYGDWTDLVVVEVDPEDESRYLGPQGPEPFAIVRETVQVRGAEPVAFDIRSTRWGPIVGEDSAGRPLALSWTAHHPHATNLGMMEFERAGSLEELLEAANRSGGPVQNVLAADSAGHIGWTLMGQVPIRANYDPTLPQSWREPETGWVGWRSPQEFPRTVDPGSGRLWSANSRMIDAPTWLGFVGDGGYDLGARAAQIRDGLFALRAATRDDMVALQLDDRALFLARWRDLLLDLLVDAGAAGAAPALREEAQRLVSHWSGRAAVDDAGYAIVRAFRDEVLRNVFDVLTAPARMRYPHSSFRPSNQFEASLWQLVLHRPPHLLDPRHASWDEALLAALDRALASLQEDCGELQQCSWGARNRLQMRHPMSSALGFLARWLDMPSEPLPGDANMPRVQRPSFGASERLVVSPGREGDGLFQMPGGQSGHPLSPFYRAGHEAWARGEPLPLLPGEPRHTLRLAPPEYDRNRR